MSKHVVALIYEEVFVVVVDVLFSLYMALNAVSFTLHNVLSCVWFGRVCEFNFYFRPNSDVDVYYVRFSHKCLMYVLCFAGVWGNQW